VTGWTRQAGVELGRVKDWLRCDLMGRDMQVDRSISTSLVRGLAQNPAVPIDVLLLLLQTWPEQAGDGLRRRRELPVPVQNALVHHPLPSVRRMLAKHPDVDPQIRGQLLTDPDWLICDAAFGVPGQRPLTDDALMQLFTRLDEPFEDEVFTSAELREDLFASMPRDFRRLVRLAATHPRPGVRLIATENPQLLGESLLQALLTDSVPEVRAAAASWLEEHQRVRQPADLDERSYFRSALTLQRPLSRMLVDQMLATGDDRHLYWVAVNPTTPPDAVETLLRHPAAEIRQRVATRADLSSEQLLRLAVDPAAEVRTRVSTHPGLTEAQRATIDIDVTTEPDHGHYGLAHHCPDPRIIHADETVPPLAEALAWARSVNPLLRRRAARNRELPMALVTDLADDPDLGVRVILARCHPDAPPALLLRCYLDYHGCGRDQLSELPQFPTEGLASFADHHDSAVRRLVALDPQATPELIQRLSTDSDASVRQAMARCPRLPAADIIALLDNPDLAEHAAANTALPLEQIQRILGTGFQQVN
jgi:hypothetical protein